VVSSAALGASAGFSSATGAAGVSAGFASSTTGAAAVTVAASGADIMLLRGGKLMRDASGRKGRGKKKKKRTIRRRVRRSARREKRTGRE